MEQWQIIATVNHRCSSNFSVTHLTQCFPITYDTWWENISRIEINWTLPFWLNFCFWSYFKSILEENNLEKKNSPTENWTPDSQVGVERANQTPIKTSDEMQVTSFQLNRSFYLKSKGGTLCYFHFWSLWWFEQIVIFDILDDLNALKKPIQAFLTKNKKLSVNFSQNWEIFVRLRNTKFIDVRTFLILNLMK